MKARKLLAASLGFLWMVSGAMAADCAYPVYQLPSAPALDGKLDDPAWKDVPEAAGFHILGDGSYDLTNKTYFRAGWTATTLYIAGVCQQPDADKLPVAPMNNENLFQSDCVEIHLAPHKGESKQQFIVNPKGAKWSYGCPLDDWKMKAAATANSWTFEMEVPFSVLGGKPADGAKWSVNLSRFISTDSLYETWSPSVKNFHDVANYGTFDFLPQASSPMEKMKVEEQLNAEFLAEVKNADRENSSAVNRIKTFITVYARNATVTLALNGKDVPWPKKEYSLQTPKGVTVIKHTVSVNMNQAENIVGVTASATGDNPGVRIEASREATDAQWKAGVAEGNDWLKANFDDKAWSPVAAKARDFDWSKQESVTSPDSYAWIADAAAKKVCFRQVIRGVEKSSQDVKYTVCDWGEVLAGRGYHRALVRVSQDAGKSKAFTEGGTSSAISVVWAHVPWRRRDANPEQKAIFIHDAKTGKRIENFEIINLNQEYLDVVFEPQTIPGDYEIYYLPYFERFKRPGYWMSTETYVKPYTLCDENWLSRVSWLGGNHNAAKPKIADGNWQRFPRAELVEMQSRTEFDSFHPMEVPATKEEVAEILAKNQKSEYLVFPEDRKYPVKMFETVPLKWVKTGPTTKFKGEAQPGEYYCFQLGVFAARNDIKNATVDCSGLKNEKGEAIPADAFRCINTGGVDWLGNPLVKTFNMLKGKVRPLWIGFQIPDNAKGVYAGTITVKPEGMEPTTVKVAVSVTGDVIADKGDDEPWRHSRLRWLDSTLGLNDDELVPPYTALKVTGDQNELLNRTVVFGPLGMPSKIVSNGKEVIASPMRFDVIRDGKAVAWQQSSQDKILSAKPAKVIRETLAEGDIFQLANKTTVEADGMIRFDISITAKADVDVDAFAVEIPYNAQIAKYMTGVGQIGGFRTGNVSWKANPKAKLWMGDYDAGMQTHFLAQTKGSVTENKGILLLKADTGKVTLRKDKAHLFSFRLFVTPFKPINNKIHWSTRTMGGKTDWATVVHYHHATPENPWINYPFLTTDKLAATQKNIIEKGGHGVQLYYTTRELSNRVVEMWALRGLGTEVFDGIDVYTAPDCPPKTEGHPWLREHLVNGFSSAWPTVLAPGVVDQAIGNSKLSRWHNYYIEGLSWLIRKGCLCSLYLDDIGYDREIMKRVARSLSKTNAEYRMEYHTGPGYEGVPRSPINDWGMEYMPYLTKLWFGEGFNYNRSPDYWLVEISGIPFGITGEMLDLTHTANSWRGMIYGISGRQLKEAGGIYKLWDDFGIQDAEWLGYWNPKCPVKTGRDDIMVSVYKKNGKSLICLASWANEEVNLSPVIDWQALGLDPVKTTLTAPEIKGFQTPQTFKAGDPLPVKKAQGLMLVAEQKKE